MVFSMIGKTPEERKAISAKAYETRKRNIAAREAEQERARLLGIRIKFGLEEDIRVLQEKLGALKTVELFSSALPVISQRYLLTEEEIVSSSIEWKLPSGVYFLICDSSVVYVGQSVNVFSRIGTHANEKKFDRFAFVPCEPSMLNKLESLYIHMLRPRLNGSFNNGEKHAPMTLDELLGESHEPSHD